nr:zinc-dependent metalloprotease family protein [Oligoflexus tunisiensis]
MLNKGDDYEFMYIAERKSWVLTRYPTTEYQARALRNGILPQLVRPRTRVTFADGNWVRDLHLPNPSPAGYRVVVETQATWSLSVRGLGDASAHATNLKTGDTVAFVVDEQGKWKQETITIDMLLLYSDKAAQRIGETQERSRMLEGLRLTNEALENSRANFRVRMVGLEMVPARDHWTILDHPLSDLRIDEAVQKRRNELRADAIYYEGTEAGCGLAWINRSDPQTSAFNMVGTGSLNCGTTVMRHEFGHNMGLDHGVSTDDTGGQYWVGNSRVGTIMGGNKIPFYSSPNLYTRHGVPLGVEGEVDAVRAMNEFSATVAAFR